MNRRSLLRRMFAGVSVGTSLPQIYSQSETSEYLPELIGSGPAEPHILHLIKGDKIDECINYLMHCPDQEKRQREFCEEFLKERVFPISLPDGFVVELGVWKCGTYDFLINQYGKSRCRGYDIYNYMGRSDIIVKDVRNFYSSDDLPIALGRNHVSSWADSFSSRWAGLKFLTRNLVLGGYLIESAVHRIPRNVRLSGFKIIVQYKNTMILQKMSNQAFCSLI